MGITAQLEGSSPCRDRGFPRGLHPQFAFGHVPQPIPSAAGSSSAAPEGCVGWLCGNHQLQGKRRRELSLLQVQTCERGLWLRHCCQLCLQVPIAPISCSAGDCSSQSMWQTSPALHGVSRGACTFSIPPVLQAPQSCCSPKLVPGLFSRSHRAEPHILSKRLKKRGTGGYCGAGIYSCAFG